VARAKDGGELKAFTVKKVRWSTEQAFGASYHY
jgi:hypothetical protein